jgi:hypothetical protein
MTPDLDRWLASPGVRVFHRRETSAGSDALWAAARTITLADTSVLGRLVRWRIPGTQPELSFDELFRNPPFIVLSEDAGHSLVSGLVGRIWTLRRDYPKLADPEEFLQWSTGGTARVVFGNWVETVDAKRAALVSEIRVQGLGSQGRLGVAAVRPLVSAFHNLIGSDGIAAAVRQAESR